MTPSTATAHPTWNADATAQHLPWVALADEVAALLADPAVHVPPRSVLPLPGSASLFVMPAHDAHVAMTKLISFTPGNAGTARPTIQGDVVVFDIATGERRLVLDGPTVTARRTAAVSLAAARRLAPEPGGPLLVVGAGVQGRAHLEAFAAGLAVTEVWVASGSTRSAEALAAHARSIGLHARVSDDPVRDVRHCPLVVTATPARTPVLHAPLAAGQFLAAVGAFTPQMVELSPALCRHAATQGTVVVDTPEATHEAGDLLQAGIEVTALPTLAQVLLGGAASVPPGPVLFKSCGWAGWDLAAARLAMRQAV